MNATERQLKSAARGTVNSSSDWDGMTLVQVYTALRSQGYSHKVAQQTTRQIKENRIWAMTQTEGQHVSKDQALVWFLEAHVSPSEALRRVYGTNVPQWAQNAVYAAWSKLNAEHRQALEDARMAA